MKIIASIAVLTIITIGIVSFIKKTPDQDLPVSPSPNTLSTEKSTEDVTSQTVIYTDSGYSPESITIKTGTKVIFVNQLDSPMWTASDPHPMHTDYASFDSRRGVASGQQYEFTFTEAGSYPYHDHLSPKNTGIVTVEN